MPPVTPAQIAEMLRLLKTGPVLIGESHDEGHARIAIRDLIDMKVVEFLSIETPVGPPGMVRADGQIRADKVGTYFGGVSTFPNRYMTTRELVDYAVAANVKVYCHDTPAIRSPLNFMARVGDDMNAYPNYARQFLPASMPELPRENQAAARFRERNEYSANYLRAHLGAGVKCLFNLVILGGADHFRADKCGAAQTLQHYLGVDGRRVFMLD